MDFREMRIFLVIAEEQSLTRAAARVFVSQPALSRLVRRLEDEVGTALFDRTTGALTLTPAGDRFRQRVAGLLEDADLAAAEARTIARDLDPVLGRTPGDLRVGVLVPAAAELTARILDTYRRSSPESTVTLVDLATRGGERALLDGTVDVAFLWTPVVSEDLDLTALFDDGLMAVLPAEHPLAGRTVLTPALLADEPFTVSETMTVHWRSSSLLPPWRHRPDHARRVPTVVDALRLIAGNQAVSIGPRSLSRTRQAAGLSFVPITQSGRPTAVVCRRSTDRRPQVRSVVAIARSVTARLGYLVPDAVEPHGAVPLASRRPRSGAGRWPR